MSKGFIVMGIMFGLFWGVIAIYAFLLMAVKAIAEHRDKHRCQFCNRHTDGNRRIWRMGYPFCNWRHYYNWGVRAQRNKADQ